MHRTFIAAILWLLAGLSSAGSVEIISARAEPDSHDRYRIQVTLRHADSGWDHYANAWRVWAPDGTLLGERRLLHPHVDEQPFTRSLNGIAIGKNITYIEIEAEDSRHGISRQRLRIPLYP